MSRTILITGANGKTGRAVVEAVSRTGAHVRAFIREEAQWPQLEGLGATSWSLGNMLDLASILKALQGCQALIHIGPPMHADERKITGHFIEAAQQTSLEQFVYYSVMHPLRREVRHHRLKLDCEEDLIDSGLPYTILQPIRYMQHLEPIWRNVVRDGVHMMPFNTKVKFNVADLLDHAAATAIVATEAGYLNGTYELAGPESLSQEDMAGIISEVIKRPVKAQSISLKDLAAKAEANGVSSDRIEQMTIMNGHYDKYGFNGNPRVLNWILGREATRFKDYVARLAHRDSSL